MNLLIHLLEYVLDKAIAFPPKDLMDMTWFWVYKVKQNMTREVEESKKKKKRKPTREQDI